MTKFEVGKVYSMNSICMHDCVWTYTVVARTDAMVTLADDKGKTAKFRINKKISEYRNAESVFPLGRYSMCPTLSADRMVG